MGAPHHIKRYGEVRPEFSEFNTGLEILEKLKNKVILPGGWAWHCMSEPRHKEYKHVHDHKDIDVFVKKDNVAEAVMILQQEGFLKVFILYDHLPDKKTSPGMTKQSQLNID